MIDLRGRKLLLASLSPRRADLLRQVGCPFEVIPHGLAEEASDSPTPRRMVEKTAERKAFSISSSTPDLVLAADTVVVIGDRVFGKPADAEDSRRMLSALSGKKHTVFTGMCLRDPAGEWHATDSEATDVYVRGLTRRDIELYVESGEGRDKAGAYAIQGLGALLVARIDGDYANVVGLPLNLFRRLMDDWRNHR